MQVKFIEFEGGELLIFNEAHQHGHMRNRCGLVAVSAGNVQAKHHRNGGFYGSSFSLQLDSNRDLSWDREMYAATYQRTFIFSTSKKILEEIEATNIRPATMTEMEGFLFPVGEGDRVESLHHFFVL